MACINMFNPDHQGLYQPPPPPPIGPRISFSSDFAVEPPPPSNRAPAGPADPDFEFSVGSHPMMAADQLFFKGRILPLKESPQGAAPRPLTTLREELQAHDDDSRPGPKGSVRWKELLGFKKPAHHSSPYKKGNADMQEEVPGDGGM